MSTSYYHLFWAIVLEAGFAAMWRDEYKNKRKFARQSYVESAAIMQASRDIHHWKENLCENCLPRLD